jgi:hypothetical protein
VIDRKASACCSRLRVWAVVPAKSRDPYRGIFLWPMWLTLSATISIGAMGPGFRLRSSSYGGQARPGRQRSERQVTTFSRRVLRPSYSFGSPSQDRGRREGRVPTAPAVRVQQKAPGRTTGTSRTSGLPCAMVLRLIRALLGAPGFLATVTCATLAHHHRFGISVGMPGPHDFVVRNDLVRRCASCALRNHRVHRIPPPTSVTIAIRPSCGGGMATRYH